MRFPWMGFIFWVGLFTWFSMIVWMRFLRERERQRTLRAIAESGKGIDGETLERLFPQHMGPPASQSWKPDTRSTARGLVVGGMVMLFVGTGLLIGAQLIGRIEPDALFGMSAGGVIVGCFGLGLLAASFVIRRMAAADEAQRAAPDGMQG